MTSKSITIPDLGDIDSARVIEVMVNTGDEVTAEQLLLTLESDKASMDIPCPEAGVILGLQVAVDDMVKAGDVIATLELSSSADGNDSAATEQDTAMEQSAGNAQQATTAVPTSTSAGDDADVTHSQADVVVIGSGPGGYSAAFRAADLGLNVVLIERYASIGGVCLNVGCIPSKALLHAAKVIDESTESNEFGVSFAAPEVDIRKLHDWQQKIVGQLTGGLMGLAKRRKVTVIQGVGQFHDEHHVDVNLSSGEGVQRVQFKHAIIAAGSQPVKLPFIPDDPRVMDSTGALALENVPERLLVIGGGIIGLELATVYHALGSKIDIVEMQNSIIAGADSDVVKPLAQRIKKRYNAIMLNTSVTAVSAKPDGLWVDFSGADAPSEAQRYDAVLVAVGRIPNGKRVGAEKANVTVDERGFIAVDDQQRTNVPHIFAIGDVVGQPMLAHKAVHEAKVAAEVCAGHKSGFDARVIPSVAYTDPEVAWVGLTENEAKEQGIDYAKGAFPWAASGRALSIGRSEGMTKLLFDPTSNRLLGAGIVGTNAGDLIAEAALAIETNCDAADISLTIHPHPTLSETVAMAAEMYEGNITDLIAPKRKRS